MKTLKSLFVFCALAATQLRAQSSEPPQVPREFRAVWVATVANIDWPSKPGLSTWQQQAELIAILNRAVELNMNAVVLQVRPAADALYSSKLEPWSEYITGQMGRAPEPYYDPLEFAVEEAHKRGLELHAWFNPYRAHAPSGKSDIASTHVSNTRPTLVHRYGQYLWLDPGDSAVRRVSTNVIVDVVKRYDIDGVHIDDYFYPYKEKDSSGNVIDFPDERTWRQYVSSGGKMSHDDWRRHNVDIFIRDLYKSIKKTKPYVKFGISPFGMWRGFPDSTKGFDAYSQLYADSRRWLTEGWLDYLTPQLYWAVKSDYPYTALLQWWIAQNAKHRNIWPGNYTGRVGSAGSNGWKAQEILDQISATRLEPGAGGNVHFSAKVLMLDRDSINEKLVGGPYAGPALVPPSPWLDSIPPPKPSAYMYRDTVTGAAVVDLVPRKTEKVWLWVVRSRVGSDWTTIVIPGWQTSHMFAGGKSSPLPDAVLVSAVDRLGNESSVVSAKRGKPPVLSRSSRAGGKPARAKD